MFRCVKQNTSQSLKTVIKSYTMYNFEARRHFDQLINFANISFMSTQLELCFFYNVEYLDTKEQPKLAAMFKVGRYTRPRNSWISVTTQLCRLSSRVACESLACETR